jgi:flagellar biosynthesis protein FlhF
MHYKKYRGETVQEALRVVQEELGPGALVLSTQMVRASGPRGWMGARVVEVTAAAERETVSEQRIAPSAARPSAVMRGVAARLQASGLDTAFVERVAGHPGLRDRAAGPQAVRLAVCETLAPLTAPEDTLAPVEVFVGPPGVGKTTTIAKIAAQTRVTHASRAWLVAADGYRVGAVEQLRLYAQIIGSPFLIARSGEELASTLDGIRRPLLVDTAGRSPKDDGNVDILAALEGRAGIRRHLVLPATATPAQTRQALDRFRPARPDRVVLTRLDETDTIAPLVSVLTEYQLPVSYLAHGQNVPDDLVRATPAVLTDWVLGDAAVGASV